MSDSRPPLALIAAVARNGVIGKDGTLPWRLPEDLKHFKRTTKGHAVIMGRKTYESIGRPLPGRRNIVVSRRHATLPGCEVAPSLPLAIELARSSDELPFVIGGERLYEEALPLATEIHLTTIDRDIEGDAYFPSDLSAFFEVESHPAEAEGVTFRLLRRRS
jgi:dihydrofolate reductase